MKRKQFVAVGAVAVTGVTIGAMVTLAASSNAATNALGSNWYGSAPYVFVNDPATPDVGAVMDATGQKAFELAFILDSGGCTPSWNGNDNVSTDTSVAALITTIRNKGGDVSASVGGYGGTKLGQDCGTATATAAAYQQVVSKYALHALDFDLEEPEGPKATSSATTRRASGPTTDPANRRLTNNAIR
ncbi:hypothetical protein [Actinocrinis sp.]|uniref:hypothetical protein n=1 Tax=Actinocrinis sp. TaxID=1920516 RepID=UPI002DDCE0EF|nr:hypothetical protein [Actinocrinis sp.]